MFVIRMGCYTLGWKMYITQKHQLKIVTAFPLAEQFIFDQQSSLGSFIQ